MNPTETVRFAVVIPAYCPEQALLELIAALSEKSIAAIVVVDDGSGPDYREIFRRAEEFPKVRLLRHAVNVGKGAALKTGFNYALCTFPDLQGVVTADADGQHHPDDIEKVASALAAEPDCVILGTRTFSGDVPWRSLVGNVVTRTVMRALVGQRVSDTQTGLRGIPAALLPKLLRTESSGYEFELDMLIAVRQEGIRIEEVPIRTIYEADNRTSHFNPLVDSMKIYFVLLRFSSVSLMTAAIDMLVFYLAYRRLGNLAASQVLGRILAVAFNYSMVRRTVFFSKLRHAAVLPKYLLLVCLSGTASYAGIQLLNTRFHIQALPAKLFVETLLFFANFAIQRDFIFGKSPADGGKGLAGPGWIDRLPRWVPQAVLAVAAAALLGIVLHGFRAGFLEMDGGWTPIGRHRLMHYTLVYWAVSAVILAAIPRAFAPVTVLLAVVAMMGALGPAAVLAVAGFLISACALGSLLLGGDERLSAQVQLCATLLGISVYIFLMTFLARLPVNYAVVYLALLAIPVAADIRGVIGRFASWGSAMLRFGARPWQQGWALALLVFVLGIHLLIVPVPESSADGLAMHLAIPVNISLHHMLTYRPERILWSVMPMGADWCYSIVYLLGGEYAARLLNFAMLLLVEALLYRLVRRWVTPAIAFLILALFASTSMVQMVTGSLFIENFLAAMVVGMVLAIWRFGETGERRFLYAAAVLAGTTLSIKFGGLAFALAAVPVAVIEIRRQWARLGTRPALVWGIALVLLLAAAAPTYVISWKLTRDPLFPFLNQAFPSPILDRAPVFMDYRWNQPLTWHTLFDLTFHSTRYFEGRPGSLGFQYLLLAPLGLLALLAVKGRLARIAAFVSVAAALFVLKFQPNARYFYPSLPLLLVPLAALFGWLPPGALRRALIALAVACVVANTWFLPSSNYYHGDFYERSPLSAAMRQTYIHQNAPMREIGQYMNRVHPSAPVFLVEGSEMSAFNAEVYSNGWHQYNVFARLQQARSPHEVLDAFNEWNVHYVVAPKPGSGIDIKPKTLQDLLSKCGSVEFQTTRLYLAHLPSQCTVPPPPVPDPVIVSAGVYDDADPAIVYQGRWSQNPGFSQTYSHTITYSNLPGSLVRFAFQGSSLTYIYTRAPNRGKAEVVIDGARKAVLDLYSPETKWQSRTEFRNLGAGRHLVVITLLEDKNPRATDRFIDVDAFEVKDADAGAHKSAAVSPYIACLGLFGWLVVVAYGGWAGRSRFNLDRAARMASYCAGATLFAWFVWLTRLRLDCWFDADDLMNLYYYWSRPWSALLKANLFFWSSYYRPGGGLFYRCIYSLWGFHPLPFQVAALILLFIDFGLLAIVVHQLTASRWCALLALLAIGIHPTFSANYFDTGTIYDVLAYTFFWAAFAWYVHIRQSGRIPGGGRLALLLCLFVAAINSKEISVTLPVAVALYELVWHPPTGWTLAGLGRWIRREGRFAAIGAVFDLAYVIGKRYGPESLWASVSYHPHLSAAAYYQSLSHYSYELLYKPESAASWRLGTVLAAMAVLAAVSRRRCLIWGLGFVLAGVLPLAFIPQRGGFAYFVPSVGWAVFATGLLGWLLDLIAGKRVWLRGAVQALSLILLFFKLAPRQRDWIEMHARAARDMQERFLHYEDQIHALIPAPRKGARILLLTDADGHDDYDVFFLIRLFYGDPGLKADRISICNRLHTQVDPAAYDDVLDWVDGRFVLVSHKLP